MNKRKPTKKNPRGAGRKAHKPTDEQRAQVYALSSFGVTQETIAKFIGLESVAFAKHYREELDRAAVERNAKVAAFLYHSASGAAISDGASYADCLKAAMFWLKTRAQWRETSHIDHSSSDGSMTPSLDISGLSTATLEEILNARKVTGA